MNDEGIRLLSPTPKVAEILLNRKPILIPQVWYDWAIGWLYDIGKTLRSRDMMVSFITSNIYNKAFQILRSYTGLSVLGERR